MELFMVQSSRIKSVREKIVMSVFHMAYSQPKRPKVKLQEIGYFATKINKRPHVSNHHKRLHSPNQIRLLYGTSNYLK